MDIMALMGLSVLGMIGLCIIILLVTVLFYPDRKIWDKVLYSILICTILLTIAGWVFKSTGLFC